MIENRVTVKEYGVLSGNSPLLVPVPTTPGYPQQRLHKIAAEKFIKLSQAVEKDLGFPLLIASGWRPHRWNSWQQYVELITKKYGSVEEGRKWLGFNSPHEVGLCFDLCCGGLEPKKATILQQLKTPLHNWLDKNEYLFGVTDYHLEVWHKEIHISLEEFRTGIANSPKPGIADNQSNIITNTEPVENYVCEDFSCIESPLVSNA